VRPTTVSLSGDWKFRRSGGPAVDDARPVDRWMPGHVPGTVHFQLERLGKIADPWYGQNELDLQWIDQQQWEWTRAFDATAQDLDRTRQELIFDGIDTVATILVNGREVGRSANMFRQVVCDVRGVLRAGRNEVLVRIDSPTAHAAAEAARNGNRVPFGDFTWVPGEVRPTGRAWIRKVQCHFGWDWGVYLATSGIWQDVRLDCGDAPRAESVTVVQEHVGPPGAPDEVRLQVTVHLASPVAASGTVTLSVDGATVEVPVNQPGDGATARGTVVVRHPRLWWPNGEGAQPLYTLVVGWSTQCRPPVPIASRRVGLRTLELVRTPDVAPDGAPAQSFYFTVNGRPVYAKGANWIPADQFVERCTPAVYRHLLGGMVETHMNMVRVWGGGWYEQDGFYDLCDELGILVWQDFMMACTLYPDTPGFLAELTAEARYQVRRLHARPCIALWCGDNENMAVVWEWWRAQPSFERNVATYEETMTALRLTVEDEDPTRAFWLSSPCNGNFGEHPDDPNFGDVHYWKVWHKKEPFSNYLTVRPRFASEFGFQSFPEPRTIRAVTPPAEMNPSSRVMEHHQRSPDGNMLITNTIARELPIPKDFDSYCWASQVNQAMAIRTAVEHWRRLRPWCMGTIYWQLNDLWPVASWSSIDYHGRWKALHHFAKRFYAPLLASLLHEGDTLSVWATSDLAAGAEVTGELEVFTFAGERVARRSVSGGLTAGGSRELASFSVRELLGDVAARDVCAFVRLSGGGNSSDNFTSLVPWKWARLPEPRVDVRLASAADGLELAVRTEQVVPFFHAEIGGTEGHFDGDWAVLRPGETVTMRWVPHADLRATVPSLDAARAQLRTLTLHDTFAHEAADAPQPSPASRRQLASV
jgi:beta-mannosidase